MREGCNQRGGRGEGQVGKGIEEITQEGFN